MEKAKVWEGKCKVKAVFVHENTFILLSHER